MSDVSAADAEEDDDDFSVDIPDIETLDATDSFQTGGAEAEIAENEMVSVDEGNVADSMDDVLSLLDEETDSDLAEIHDMLKKDDNNEPIQDDMMDMLSQMAENEKAFVDAGKMEDMDDSDEGAPKPNIDVVKRVENKKAEMEETGKVKPKNG